MTAFAKLLVSPVKSEAENIKKKNTDLKAAEQSKVFFLSFFFMSILHFALLSWIPLQRKFKVCVTEVGDRLCFAVRIQSASL